MANNAASGTSRASAAPAVTAGKACPNAKGWIAEDDFAGEYRYSGRPLVPLRTLDLAGCFDYFSNF